MKKILFSLLILCFLSVGFFKVSAAFYDFTEDFYESLYDDNERDIFRNFEKYLSENPSKKLKSVKKSFFSAINDTFTVNEIKNMGVNKVCRYILDCCILKTFGKISVEDPQSIKLAAISLGKSFEEVEKYMHENKMSGITYFQ